MTGLFGGAAPRVWATHAGAAALDSIASHLLKSLPDPLEFADALILAPNRRAARALAEALAARAGGAALLPAIRPLGDLTDEPDVWGPGGLDLSIPPAIDPLRRRLELASLIRARDAAEGGVDDPVRALAAADALAALLDAAATVDAVDWSKLATLAPQADLAAHWRRSTDFLSIVTQAWPARLAEDGLSDPGARRAMLLHALADRLERERPQRAVLVVGSTGSIAAVRRLMGVVARAPRGAVILPALDRGLDQAAWEKIGPQHPQFSLKRTLSALGVERGEVAYLDAPTPAAEARVALLREALAPPETTADWLNRLAAAGGREMAAAGAAGLSVIEAETEEDEARICALLLREALETPDRTAALVTPDPALGRRVAVKLARWGVEIAPTAGAPLLETPPGQILDLLIALAPDLGEPAALEGLLRHPLAHFALSEEERAVALDALDRPGKSAVGWRGPRRWTDLADFLSRAPMRAKALLAAAGEALAPLAALSAGPVTLDALSLALAQAAETAAGPDGAWGGAAGEAAARALETMIAEGAALGPCTLAQALRTARALLAASAPVAADLAHPRLAIWGPLEARLQRRDLVILAGLSEGLWPKPPSDDPFLNRALKSGLGLPSPDERIGLSAHDFAGLAAAPRAVLVRSKRVGGAPAVASRWLWRLSTLLKGADCEALVAPDPDPRTWARALDAADRIAIAPPTPRPPVAARPTRFSVSDVETLIRDPYAFYARTMLGLRPAPPVGAPVSAAERGAAVHAALEQHGPGDGVEALLDRIERALKDGGVPETMRRIERARLAKAAHAFTAWAQARAGRTAAAESSGERAHEEGWILAGRADRIDWDTRGFAAVIDYKTGSSPTARQAKSGLSPQLPLLAAILAGQEGFEGAPTDLIAAELIYWRFRLNKPGPEPIDFETSAAEAAAEAWERLAGLVRAYRDPAQPYLSKPRVAFAREVADYDQLARRAEWADASGGEE